MKKIIYSRFLVFTFLFLVCSVGVWGQTETEKLFDISKGDVIFTDGTCSGKNSAGIDVSYEHNPENNYIITGTTTQYYVQVGAENALVSKNFIIYLDGVDIRSEACAFSVWNEDDSKVAVILKDGTINTLYSGKNRAGLEKSGGASADGTLLITCEQGYTAWQENPTKGHTTGAHNHNAGACINGCGSLDARSGNAWDRTAAETYNAGAGIGTKGHGSGGVNKENTAAGTNALVNLTIAGGNIQARGAWGYASGTSGGAAAIGTGCAYDSGITAGTITGLNITGGNITAYRIDASAACIGGGYRSGYVNMNIYGGTIDAGETARDPLTENTHYEREFVKLRAAAIGGGGGGESSSSPAGATVIIHNGKIEAYGQYGAAIGSGSGGKTGAGQAAKVIIYDGEINAKTEKGNGQGSGAAIGSGGSTGTGKAGNAIVEIKGGMITASSELGADIGGGGTNSSETGGNGGKGDVTISGGTITAKKGGIGGGRANAGKGGDAEIKISGENTEITAKSIGGGRSETNTGGNVTLIVDDGKLDVADFIGGGVGGTDKDKIGWAKVYINGGDISGRTVMKASQTGGCVFNMKGGTLTSPIKDQPGGAVYMIDPNGESTISGGIINGCKGSTGGAVYMSGGTFAITGGTISACEGTQGGGAVYMDGGTFTISGSAEMKNNTASDGGAVYLAGEGGLFNVNGGTIQGNNQSIEGHGGAVYMKAGKFTMTGGTISSYKRTTGGAVYMEGGTFGISGGTISDCEGTKSGGAVYMAGGDFTISGNAMMQNNTAPDGGAVYLAGTGTFNVNGGTIQGNNQSIAGHGGAVYMKAGNFTMTNGSISSYKRTTGGAVYMEDGTFGISGGTISNSSATTGGAVYMAGGTFGISGGTISNSSASTGGAVYMEDGTFGISGTAKMQYNNATDGGAVYLAGTGTFKVNGGTINSNEVTGNGGAIYLNNGTFYMAAGKVEANRSTSGNGAGIYIVEGTVNVTGGEVCRNIAAAGRGGGFYVSGGTVTGGTVTLSNGKIASNKAAKAGGGIYLNTAKVEVNGCTLTENEATAGNGGGIFLANGASMTYNGGQLTFNKAKGTGSIKTAYQSDGENIQGVGGGIYISTNSSLTFGEFGKLGVYANSADMAADDLFANGEGTTLVVPNVQNMSLDNYAGDAEGLGWYEDYFVGDSEYDNSQTAKGSNYNSFEYRFKKAQEKGKEYMREYKFNDPEKIAFENKYVAFALGFLFSNLTIQVEGLKPGESCIFSVSGTAEGGKYKYQVPIHGTKAQYDVRKLIKLPVDKYTVELMQVWPWAYELVDPNGRTIKKMNSQDGGVYHFEIRHKSTSIVHDEEHIDTRL